MITHRNSSKMKSKVLLTRLHGNYKDIIGEFSNMSYGVIRIERVKKNNWQEGCLKAKYTVPV